METPDNTNNQKKRISGFLALVFLLGILALLVSLLKYTAAGTNFIWQISQGGKILFPLVTISALIDSINPCAFSVLLLTLAFLFSMGKNRSKILFIGGLYIFGVFLIYILIGLGIFGTLHIFNTPHFMAKLGATLLILLGALNLIGYFFPAFPVRLRIPQAAHRAIANLIEKVSGPTAVILGFLVGLCEFPCTGGPYLMVLGLLHDKATFTKGLAYLVWYNLLFVLPLVVILFLSSNKILLKKVQEWKRRDSSSIRFFGSLAAILLGILIFNI